MRLVEALARSRRHHGGAISRSGLAASSCLVSRARAHLGTVSNLLSDRQHVKSLLLSLDLPLMTSPARIDDVDVLSLDGRGPRTLTLVTFRVRHFLDNFGGLSIWLHGRAGPSVEKIATLMEARLKLLLLHLLLVHVRLESLHHELALLLQLLHSAHYTVHSL